MKKINPDIDNYLSKVKKWQNELSLLREIILEFELSEVLKWKTPCYTLEGKNVIILNSFKEYCVIGFFKGVLLRDKENLLVSPGENSQTVRMIKFRSAQEIIRLEPSIKRYIHEAIQIEREGLKVVPTGNSSMIYPEELIRLLEENPDVKTAFEALTAGRKRAYLLYFSAPKKSETRVNRIKKYLPIILQGKGINDCTCGLSKRMPTCDGSHKTLGRK